MPVLLQSAGRRGELLHEHVTPRRVKLEGGGRIRIRAHPRDIEPSDVMAHVEDCLQGGDDSVFEAEVSSGGVRTWCNTWSVKPRTDESTSQVSLLSRALSKAVAQLGEAREHHKQAAKLIRACSPNTRERLQQTLEDAAAFVEDLSDRVDFQIKSQIKECDANAKREQQLTSQKSAVLQAAGAGVPRPAHKPAQGVDIGNRNSPFCPMLLTVLCTLNSHKQSKYLYNSTTGGELTTLTDSTDNVSKMCATGELKLSEELAQAMHVKIAEDGAIADEADGVRQTPEEAEERRAQVKEMLRQRRLAKQNLYHQRMQDALKHKARHGSVTAPCQQPEHPNLAAQDSDVIGTMTMPPPPDHPPAPAGEMSVSGTLLKGAGSITKLVSIMKAKTSFSAGGHGSSQVLSLWICVCTRSLHSQLTDQRT